MVYDFHQALEEEAAAAKAGGYDFSVIAVKDREGLTEEAIEEAIGTESVVFSENGFTYVLLPLYNKEEAAQAAKDLQPCSIASLEGRDITMDELIQEASV